MIRGTILPVENGWFAVDVPQLGLFTQGTSLQNAVEMADDWLREMAGKEPEAHVEVFMLGRLAEGAPYRIRVVSLWSDPALMEAVRIQRGKRCSQCEGQKWRK